MTNGSCAWVDAADLAWALGFRWSELATDRSRTAYPTASIGRRTAYMHKEIAVRAGFPASATVDHIDGNGLNNTRMNLRPASRSQQQGNRPPTCKNASGYRGAHWWVPAKCNRAKPCWVATIRIDGKNKHLGNFDTAESAARVYDQWAKAKWGEFAYLNLPEFAS